MQSTDIPPLTAFLLGVLTALNPCQLTINISALTYEYRNGKSVREALVYICGRILTYSVLGVLLICVVGGGRNIDSFATILSEAEHFLPYLLFAVGIFFMYRGLTVHEEHSDDCHNCRRIIRHNGPLGSLMLGIVLALAFCPESAVMYFGVMIPMAVTSSMGIVMPLLFAIGAALPVLAVAIAMKKAESVAYRIIAVFDNVQKWINIVVGLFFLLLGIFILLL